MVAKMNIESGLSELLKNGESGHRLVLVLHAIALELKLQGYEFEEKTEDYLELLLDIEHDQKMDDDEWTTFQKSAEKRGKKILQKLQQLGYFKCLQN